MLKRPLAGIAVAAVLLVSGCTATTPTPTTPTPGSSSPAPATITARPSTVGLSLGTTVDVGAMQVTLEKGEPAVAGNATQPSYLATICVAPNAPRMSALSDSWSASAGNIEMKPMRVDVPDLFAPKKVQVDAGECYEGRLFFGGEPAMIWINTLTTGLISWTS